MENSNFNPPTIIYFGFIQHLRTTKWLARASSTPINNQLGCDCDRMEESYISEEGHGCSYI